MSLRQNCLQLMLLAVLGSLGLASLSLAQAPDKKKEATRQLKTVHPLPGATSYWIAGPAGAGTVAGELRKAAEAVRNADGDEETSAARKALAELVEKCFDADMVNREKELAELEKRLAKLREQLDRRRTKKQDIMDLQIKVLLNEADGLGFYSGGEKNDFSPFGYDVSVARPMTIALPQAPPPPAYAPPVDAASPVGAPVPRAIKILEKEEK
jgi:hypothetical protein